MQFDYPAIEAEEVDLLLVTHEHVDHNGVEAVAGEPDDAARRPRARTSRRSATSSGSPPSTTSRPGPSAATTRSSSSTLDGVRVAHFGDFGQAALRPEQREAIGEVDLLFLPVGGGPTIGGRAAAGSPERSTALGRADALPDAAISFLETEEAFVAAMGEVLRLDAPTSTPPS